MQTDPAHMLETRATHCADVGCSDFTGGLTCCAVPRLRVLFPFVTQMARPAADDAPTIESIAKNRRARHEYQILDTWEAGIMLTGSEVKALRDGRANVSDAFGVINGDEIFLLNLHISQYEQAGYSAHEPTRTRKLLLHRKEIEKLIGAVTRQGLTVVPLELYFKNGRAKVVIALARGKKMHDKREDLKKKDDVRAMARAMKK